MVEHWGEYLLALVAPNFNQVSVNQLLKVETFSNYYNKNSEDF